MEGKGYLIMTNNPLVAEKLKSSKNLIYQKISYLELLKAVRDKVHQGCRLLTHPLAGSVKPGETPYRSVMISDKEEEPDAASVQMIENAIGCFGKFADHTSMYSPDVMKDFALIDWTLLKSGLETAGIWK